ncbi:hypothetical protein [[Phormidium] sp. ETS-05]|uniref:hypothetical protein n=1 Tax=[Phormidium] sp. ETS-05 TaxID=222819 RepID=UPI0018EEF252|nr:hypothetical protein [[Phormidium] sp. ETS-05]
MERGLLWLPLLGLFIWLAWAGWNEYHKVEAYKVWAANFDRAKYDIYAVLGQKGDLLTWGKPTRRGPVNLQSFSLKDVKSLRLLVNGEAVELTGEPPSQSGKVDLEFSLAATVVRIPFTEVSLAQSWGKHLEQEGNRSGSASVE